MRSGEGQLGTYSRTFAFQFVPQRWVDVGVTHDVARAAGWDFVDVHVEPSALVPREQSVVVVDLRALRLVVMAHVAANPSRFSASNNKKRAD